MEFSRRLDSVLAEGSAIILQVHTRRSRIAGELPRGKRVIGTTARAPRKLRPLTYDFEAGASSARSIIQKSVTEFESKASSVLGLFARKHR